MKEMKFKLKKITQVIDAEGEHEVYEYVPVVENLEKDVSLKIKGLENTKILTTPIESINDSVNIIFGAKEQQSKIKE